MTRVFQLANVLELVIDGLDQGALAEQNFIQEGEQARLHLFFEFGDELHSLGPELREEGLGDGAPIPHQFAEHPAGQLRYGFAIIDVAWSEHNGQQVPTVATHQMDFAAVEPARAGDPALGYILENLVRFNAQVVTDFQWCGVNEGEAGAAPQAGGEKGRQREQRFRFQLYEARIADALGKGASEMETDILKIEGLESPKAGGLEEDKNSHHFAHTQGGLPSAVILTDFYPVPLQGREHLAAELVTIIEQV